MKRMHLFLSLYRIWSLVPNFSFKRPQTMNNKMIIFVLSCFFYVWTLFTPMSVVAFNGEKNNGKSAVRNYHQINLEAPVKSIDSIRYQNGEKVDWELSNDGKYIKIKNYQYPNQIAISVTYENGKVGHYFKTSCFIEPLPQL